MVPDGHFSVAGSPFPKTVWFHLVLNFLGPNVGEGFIIYRDATEELRLGVKITGIRDVGRGEVVIGRYGEIYSSLLMDELLLFNRKLTLDEIQILYDMDE